MSSSFSERKPTAWLRLVLNGMRNSLPTKLMSSARGRMPLKPSGVPPPVSPPEPHSRTRPLAMTSRMGPMNFVFMAPEKDAVSAMLASLWIVLDC
jgi:hypothetical protein